MNLTITELRTTTLAVAAAMLLAACAGCDPTSASGPVQVDGVVWQPDNATVAPRGNWDRLGARELLVQWTAVDGTAFVPAAGGAFDCTTQQRP